jgi:hypothetical protein
VEAIDPRRETVHHDGDVVVTWDADLADAARLAGLAVVGAA